MEGDKTLISDDEDHPIGENEEVMICGILIPMEIQRLILFNLLSKNGILCHSPDDRWEAWACTRRVCRSWREMSDETVYFVNEQDALYQPLHFALNIKDKETMMAAFRCVLKNKSSNPGGHGNWAIIRAIDFNLVEVVDILLRDPRIDFDEEWNTEVTETLFRVFEEREEIAKMMLEDGRIPSSEMDYFLSIGCRAGLTDIVKVILRSDKTLTITSERYCIMEALRRGHKEIISILLREPKFPIADDIRTVLCNNGFLGLNELIEPNEG